MIRLFVGTSPGDDLESQAVVEYTARQYCSLPLDITWMVQARKGDWSGWKTASWRTPFTGYRWGIPAACGFKGRAIYIDSDFIIRADLAELWTQPIPGVALVRNPVGKLSTSCILFDCAKAKAHVPDLPDLRKMDDAHGVLLAHFRAHTHLLAATDGNWDCGDLRGYAIDDPGVKAIHYTRMEHQPHLVKYAIPRLKAEGRTHWYTGPVGLHPRADLQALFDQLLAEAIAAGYTLDRYCGERVDIARRAFTYSHSKVTK